MVHSLPRSSLMAAELGPEGIGIANLWLIRCGSVLGALTMLYSVIAWLAVRKQIRTAAFNSRDAPPVTILKPLCGSSPAR